MMIGISRPGLVIMVFWTSCQSGLSTPSNETIWSPGLIPALSAGEPGSTTLMTAWPIRNSGTSVPYMYSPAIRPTARMIFIAGPAAATKNLCHLDFEKFRHEEMAEFVDNDDDAQHHDGNANIGENATYHSFTCI